MAVATKQTSKRYAVRKPTAKKPAAKPHARQRRPAGPRVYSGLSAWKDLSSGNAREIAPRSGIRVAPVTTLRFGVIMLVLAGLFTAYVGHVNATQDVLAQVQQERRENLRLHLKYNRVKGEYDRMTGPSVIYDRARRIGMEEGHSYGPSILISGAIE
jgi:hypothetical protein